MTKRIISFVFLLFIIFSLFTYNSYASEDITLVINDKPIVSDVSPVIIDGRTMVPVRAVFDSLGADVLWNGTFRQVTVSSVSAIMVFTIDSNFVYVDGVSIPIDVPPVIINDRTFVPIRFIAEKLGYEVFWDDATRTVRISNSVFAPLDDSNQSQITLSEINAVTSQEAIEITVSTSSKVEPKTMQLSSPERLVFDFYNVSQTCLSKNLSFDSGLIKEIRWAKHDDYTRLVIETLEPVSYSIRYTTSACIITIPIKSDADVVNPSSSDNKDDEEVVFDSQIPIVVIDAGHGGYDSGAIGYDSAGNPILKEKELNLTISKYVAQKLKALGINVIMTRSSDVALGTTTMTDLVARAEIANQNGADLFISIHNNAFTTSDANGTTVLYAGLENNGGYGITGYQLAENILKPLAKATGLKNRGTVMSPQMVVLKKTAMPAALVECGFVTSYIDQIVLSDPQKLVDIADAICEGIVVSLRQTTKIQ